MIKDHQQDHLHKATYGLELCQKSGMGYRRWIAGSLC